MRYSIPYSLLRCYVNGWVSVIKYHQVIKFTSVLYVFFIVFTWISLNFMLPVILIRFRIVTRSASLGFLHHNSVLKSTSIFRYIARDANFVKPSKWSSKYTKRHCWDLSMCKGTHRHPTTTTTTIFMTRFSQHQCHVNDI